MTDQTVVDFETHLQELNKIVETMERGDLKLNEALQQFERGVTLSRLCQQALESAEQTIKILSSSPEGDTLGHYDEKLNDASE